jgi:hypothetical protein
MPDQADPTTESQLPGEPMTDQADLFTEAQPHGEPMHDPTDLPIDSMSRELMTQDDDESMADTERALTPEISARAALNGVTCELGHDEVRVLTRIAERLRGGQGAYGQLDLTTDLRQFRTKEAREEIEDALVYFACAWLQEVS